MSVIAAKKNRTDPLVLIKNKSYPAYQLAATTSGKTTPETVLTIAILETMKWLRGRSPEHLRRKIWQTVLGHPDR
jgi:glutamine synthetase type III